MTILLFTDASTKNGHSCWAYRSDLDEEVTTGVVNTHNTAAIEILAIIKGLESLPYYSEVLVISDFLSAVRTINNFENRYCIMKGSIGECQLMRNRLIELCDDHYVDAIWVASNCPNERHLEVDQMSKIMLQEYLTRRVI